MDEDVPLIQVSPLIMENHFHPLFDIDEETEVRRIATNLLPPIIDSVSVLAR